VDKRRSKTAKPWSVPGFSAVRKSREDLDALRRSKVGAFGGLGALAWKNLSKLGQFLR
jgi:hypothetical protein